jgi:two-component system OmpR family response regulator
MKILLAEDDATLANQLMSALRDDDYVVDQAANGQTALELLGEGTYDAIVLDLGLPLFDGLTVLRNLREGKSNNRLTPVLVLSARDTWSDRVDAIDRGADDYVTKPYATEEVIARLRALIRRSSGHATSRVTWGDIALDVKTKRVTYAGTLVRMTKFEYKVFEKLMLHGDRLVSREELENAIYDDERRAQGRGGDSINVFVNRLRKKLPVGMIEVENNRGYRLAPAPCESEK